MYLIQQAELVVTKCTTMQKMQEECDEFVRKNGINGNLNVSTSTSTSLGVSRSPNNQSPSSISHNYFGNNPSSTTTSTGRNGENFTPHDLSIINTTTTTPSSNNTSSSATLVTTGTANNFHRMTNSNRLLDNTNNKNSATTTSSIEDGSKPNQNNLRTKTATITGERLQFFKGNFYLF